MASAKSILPLALAGGALLYFGSKAVNIAQVAAKLKVTGFKVLKFNAGLLASSMDIQLQVQNPGSTDVPLEYYTGSIIYSGRNLSDFSFNGNGQNYLIKARSITPLVFQARLSSLSTVTTIINLIKAIAAGQKVNTVFNIKSSLYAAGIDLPVNFDYDLKPGVVSGIGKLHFKRLLHVAVPVTNLFGRKKRRRKAAAAKAAAATAAPKSTASTYTPPVEPVIAPADMHIEPAPGTPVNINSGSWQGNGAVQGIGAVSKKKFSYITTYSSVDGMFTVYQSPTPTSSRNKWIELGNLKRKPTANDVAVMIKWAHENKVPGIGKPSARLEFGTNEEMEKHFGCKDRPRIMFSKN